MFLIRLLLIQTNLYFFREPFRVVAAPVLPRSPTKTRIMRPSILSLFAGVLGGVVHGVIDLPSPGL